MFWFWLAFIIAFIVLDIVTDNTLLFLCIALGGITSAIENHFGVSIPIQTLSCILVSIASIIVTYVLAEKSTQNKNSGDAIHVTGQIGIVTDEINGITGTGMVKVRGSQWTAYAENQETIIPVGTKVEILDVEGCHLTVREKVSEEQPEKKE